jgi:hypothetical protein
MFDSESPYLKAADHAGMNRQCVIKNAGTDVLNIPGKPEQPGAWIDIGAKKPIWLSKTNGRTLIGAFGNSTEEWLQKKVLVTTKEYNMEGKNTTGWVIIPLLDEKGFDDEIPF